MNRLFRWRAILPLTLVLIALAGLWWLYADGVVERSVEDTGADLVGAKVDVATADLRLGEGKVLLQGLAVANPNAPMKNLFEADEVLADIRMKPLLTRKLVIEQVAVRGVRLGTARTTSGALEGRDSSGGILMRQLETWRSQLRVPPLSLDGLGDVVNLQAISRDSLQTLAAARRIVAEADSTARAFEERLRALNPGPTVDSARALVERLSAANPLRLGVTGVTQLAGSGRRVLTSMDELGRQLAALDSSAKNEVRGFRGRFEQLNDVRRRDYAYALRLLRLPSVDAPELSPPALTEAVSARLTPILYWVNRVGDLLPPGLDPRRFAGRSRARRPGVTVAFPKPGEYPRFLLELAEIDLEVGGAGAAAGRYEGRLAGVTTTPALYGRPVEVAVARSGGRRGPTDLTVHALLDHTRRPLRDSARVRMGSTQLPTVELRSIGARLGFGVGTSDLRLVRVGDSLEGSWHWRSDAVSWTRLSPPDTAARRTVRQRVEDALWRSVSSLRDVQLDVQLAGPVRAPRLTLSSNLGRVVAQTLRAEVGRQIAQAQQEIRAEVDRIVREQTLAARGRIDSFESDVARRIGVNRETVAQVREQLEQQLRRLTRGVIPGGS